MSKFKVGDRVKVIAQKSSSSNLSSIHPKVIGGIGIITERGHNPENEVRFPEKIDGRKIWYIEDECLELVEPKTKTKQLTHSQFLDHIKQHGPTKARITEGLEKVPAGAVLVFKANLCSSCIISEQNNDYGVDTMWSGFWKESYPGKFEIVEESQEEATEEELRKYSTRNYYPPFEGEIKGFNQSFIKKTISIINNAFKSKENKAMENFGLGTTDQLNERGRDEFVDYLFQNLPEQKKGFLEKIVEAGKEEK